MQKSQAPKEKDHKKKKNLTSAVTKEEKRQRNNSGIENVKENITELTGENRVIYLITKKNIRILNAKPE